MNAFIRNELAVCYSRAVLRSMEDGCPLTGILVLFKRLFRDCRLVSMLGEQSNGPPANTESTGPDPALPSRVR